MPAYNQSLAKKVVSQESKTPFKKSGDATETFWRLLALCIDKAKYGDLRMQQHSFKEEQYVGQTQGHFHNDQRNQVRVESH
jgi:hypothetical protein